MIQEQECISSLPVKSTKHETKGSPHGLLFCLAGITFAIGSIYYKWKVYQANSARKKRWKDL